MIIAVRLVQLGACVAALSVVLPAVLASRAAWSALRWIAK